MRRVKPMIRYDFRQPYSKVRYAATGITINCPNGRPDCIRLSTNSLLFGNQLLTRDVLETRPAPAYPIARTTPYRRWNCLRLEIILSSIIPMPIIIDEINITFFGPNVSTSLPIKGREAPYTNNPMDIAKETEALFSANSI